MRLLYLVIALLFLGCGAQKEVVVATPKPLPQWYTQPPQNSATTLYGVGEGINQKAAIDDALSGMLSVLGVKISSTFESQTVEHQGRQESFDKRVEHNIKSERATLHVSEYKVVEGVQYGYRRYIVLIQSDRKKLFEGMKSALDEQYASYNQHHNALKNSNALEQLAFELSALENFKNLDDTLLAMQTLNNTFNENYYRKRYGSIVICKEDLLANITFNVHANIQDFAAPIEKGLSAKGLHVKRNALLSIEIKAQINQTQSYGFTLARTTFDIKTRDASGRIVASNTFNITGQSTQGFAIAKQNVAMRLEQKVASEGVERVLGFGFELKRDGA